MNKSIVIVGAGGHGKVVADIAKLNQYENIVFLDDTAGLHVCGSYPVVGKTEAYTDYADWDFVVAIGNNAARRKFHEKLAEQGIHLVSLVHPKAVIAEDAKIGAGTVVLAGAVVNSATVIGDGCIINTGATVDHDNSIQDFVHIGPGVHLAGTVSVGKRSWLGIGAIVSNNVVICDDVTVGAGAVVLKDIKEKGTYVGVPTRRIK